MDAKKLIRDYAASRISQIIGNPAVINTEKISSLIETEEDINNALNASKYDLSFLYEKMFPKLSEYINKEFSDTFVLKSDELVNLINKHYGQDEEIIRTIKFFEKNTFSFFRLLHILKLDATTLKNINNLYEIVKDKVCVNEIYCEFVESVKEIREDVSLLNEEEKENIYNNYDRYFVNTRKQTLVRVLSKKHPSVFAWLEIVKAGCYKIDIDAVYDWVVSNVEIGKRIQSVNHYNKYLLPTTHPIEVEFLQNIYDFIKENISEMLISDKIDERFFILAMQLYNEIEFAGMNLLFAIRDVIVKEEDIVDRYNNRNISDKDILITILNHYLGNNDLLNDNKALYRTLFLFSVKNLYSKNTFKKVKNTLYKIKDKAILPHQFESSIRLAKAFDFSQANDELIEKVLQKNNSDVFMYVTNDLGLEKVHPDIWQYLSDKIDLFKCNNLTGNEIKNDAKITITDMIRKTIMNKDKKISYTINRLRDIAKIANVSCWHNNVEVLQYLLSLVGDDFKETMNKTPKFCDNDNKKFIYLIAMNNNIIIQNNKELNIYEFLLGSSEKIDIRTIKNPEDLILKNKKVMDVLRNKFEVDVDFIRNNVSNIIDFVHSGNMNKSIKYLNSSQNKKIIPIALSMMNGTYDEFVWNKERLQIEIDDEISESQYQNWKKDENKTINNVTITDCSDFESILTMGATPVSTCQSYINGCYNECLLSNYDECKKILRVYKGERQVGRAILRLTKVKGKSSDISFDESATDVQYKKVRLVIFVEKMYTYLGYKEYHDEIMKEVNQFLMEKAKSINAELCYASCYDMNYFAENNPEYTFKTENVSVMVTASRNGSQYIDSLSGNMSDTKKYSWLQANAYFPQIAN